MAPSSHIISTMRALALTLSLFFSFSALGAPSCEELLSELRPLLSLIRPVLGTPAEFLSQELPAPLHELIEKEGGELYFLGSGTYGKVYRWVRTVPQESLVVKFYESPTAAKSDDLSFQILRRVSASEDFIQVISEVRAPTDHVRFYQDLHGITLQDLESTQDIPPEIRGKIISVFQDFQSDLILRFKGINPEGATASVGQVTMIQFPNGPLISFGLHKKNILFDIHSSRLWVIDPF